MFNIFFRISDFFVLTKPSILCHKKEGRGGKRPDFFWIFFLHVKKKKYVIPPEKKGKENKVEKEKKE